MQADQLMNVVALCEKSKLDYFKYVMNGEEIVFSKNQSQLQDMKLEYKSTIARIEDHGLIEGKTQNINEGKVIKEGSIQEHSIVTIKSPHIGIIHLEEFLHKESKEITVHKGDVICTIEAMKIYNNVVSSVTGIIMEILVNNGDQIEYGQPLLSIRESNNE